MLLLAMTVLVVEAAIEHSLRVDQELRWALPGRTAAAELIDKIGEPVRGVFDAMWEATGVIESGHWSGHDAKHPRDALAHAVTALRAATRESAVVLAATETLQEINESAADLANHTHALQREYADWESDYGRHDHR